MGESYESLAKWFNLFATQGKTVILIIGTRLPLQKGLIQAKVHGGKITAYCSLNLQAQAESFSVTQRHKTRQDLNRHITKEHIQMALLTSTGVP
ncbi:hypothetical protein AAY473_005076 [Plecturocebus cupreus]